MAFIGVLIWHSFRNVLKNHDLYHFIYHPIPLKLHIIAQTDEFKRKNYTT